MGLRRTGMLILLVTALMLAGTGSVRAEGDGGRGFAITPHFPENQAKGTLGYYDLWTAPGKTYEVTVDLVNEGATDLLVTIEANTAWTDDGGRIQYTQGKTMGGTPPVVFSEVVVPEASRMAVPAHSRIPITVTITMPQDGFDGILLGGLTFTGQSAGEEDAAGVRHAYAYRLGMILRQTAEAVKPEVSVLGARYAVAEQRLILNIENGASVLLRPLSLRVEVTSAEDGRRLYAQEHASLEMAPDSTMAYGIALEAPLPEGDYAVYVTAICAEDTWTYALKLSVQAQ